MNLFEILKTKEELAFFLASKLTALNFKKETEKEIEKFIKDFISNLITEDKNAVYFEDFEYLLRDLEKSKNYNEFVILNPYFAKNHNFKYYDFVKKLKEFIFTEKCKYILNAVNLLKSSNFNLEEIRDYNMENFKIINLVN